jgi:hypothetical protein
MAEDQAAMFCSTSFCLFELAQLGTALHVQGYSCDPRADQQIAEHDRRQWAN